MREEFVLLQKNETVEVFFSEQESSTVKIAARNLMNDMERVCG